MSDLTLSIIGIVAGGILILALAWIALLTLERSRSRRGSDDPVGPVRSVSIGARERVTLLRYRDETFMLGVSRGAVSLLARFSDGTGEAQAAETVTPPPFAGEAGQEGFVTRLRTGNRRKTG